MLRRMKTLTVALSLAGPRDRHRRRSRRLREHRSRSRRGAVHLLPGPGPEGGGGHRPGQKVKVRFRTCRPGARLEHGKCVRHVVHTVFEPAPVTAVTSSSSNQSYREVSTTGPDDEHGDRGADPPKTRQDAGEHEDDGPGRRGRGSEDHASDDAPETDD